MRSLSATHLLSPCPLPLSLALPHPLTFLGGVEPLEPLLQARESGGEELRHLRGVRYTQGVLAAPAASRRFLAQGLGHECCQGRGGTEKGR